jgi:DNA polymerase-3 subunit delta'
MNIDEYIKVNQPVLYQILVNTSLKNTYAHAYLLSGFFGMPVLDIAKYVAKTIFCKNKNPLACNNCDNCEKIDNNIFLPLIIVDGEDGTILKDSIQNIEETFSKTSIENNHKCCYIINVVEHMTTDAVNALLKFLEEPNDNVYAILTTKNILKTLPTIVSRCQVIRLYPTIKDNLIEDSVNDGINREDVEILSFIYSIKSDIANVASSEEYKLLKENLLGYLNKLVTNKDDATFFLETNIIPVIKEKDDQRLFIDLLTTFLTEAIKCHSNNQYNLKSYENLLNAIYNKIANIENVVFQIYSKRSEIDLNINQTLLFLEIDRLLNEGK